MQAAIENQEQEEEWGTRIVIGGGVRIDCFSTGVTSCDTRLHILSSHTPRIHPNEGIVCLIRAIIINQRVGELTCNLLPFLRVWDAIRDAMLFTVTMFQLLLALD